MTSMPTSCPSIPRFPCLVQVFINNQVTVTTTAMLKRSLSFLLSVFIYLLQNRVSSRSQWLLSPFSASWGTYSIRICYSWDACSARSSHNTAASVDCRLEEDARPTNSDRSFQVKSSRRMPLLFHFFINTPITSALVVWAQSSRELSFPFFPQAETPPCQNSEIACWPSECLLRLAP